jgi:hypothetical protein
MDKQQNIEARPGDAERPQETGAASPGRGGRMSRQRKTAAVLSPADFRQRQLQPVAEAA